MKNKRVLIVGAAPSVTVGLSDALAAADYVIACSSAVKYVPNADMLVSVDGIPPLHTDTSAFDAFVGTILVGVMRERGTLYHMPYETVDSRQFRNNGISAIRIAVDHGATDITLIGFDLDAYDSANASLGYAGLIAAAYPKVIAEMANKGVTIKYYAPPVTTRKNHGHREIK